MKKILAILMIRSMMLCAVGCQNTQSAFAKAEIAAKYGIEESVIDEWHSKFPKKTHLPPEYVDYEKDYVYVVLYPFAYDYDFAPDDFSEVSCKSVQIYEDDYIRFRSPAKTLALEMDISSREVMEEVVNLLQQRADVYLAQPKYLNNGFGW